MIRTPRMIYVVLTVTVQVLLGFELGSCCAQEATKETASRNLIQSENLKTGSRDWQLTRVRVDESRYRSPWIEGYCSRQSVRAGESIDIKVSTQPARLFKIEIFRTGYYGGAGARLMSSVGPIQGKTQPTPTLGEKNLNECRWETSHRLTIPDDWISGVYLGRLTTIPETDKEPYWQSYIIFVVTDDRPCDILVQCSDNTWQAYNQWPSKYSVYTHPKGNQGPWADVSFDRPYGREAQFESVVNDPLTQGSGEYLPLEFPLAYWLEQHGYDVTYCCNSDMLRPDRGLKARSFISVGHDEYWDIRQFRSVEKMRDQGVSLLFLSGNSVCWVSPFRESFDGRANRIIFRGGPYGANRPITEARAKDHGPFPERGPDEGYLMGARNVEPVNGGGDWICTMPEHWIFEGTGMKHGESIPGLIGWEYHGDPADIPGLSVVGSGTAWVSGQTPQQWTATVYEGPKGNVVFNASSIFWVQGLSDPPGHTLPWSHWSRPHGPDPRVQRITKNILDRAPSQAIARIILKTGGTSVVEFKIVGEELWARMERAVEKVNERLRKTVRILEDAKVPYAVVGGHAVRAWVAQVDEAALRTTRDVDIMVRPSDFPVMKQAMIAAGFHHRNVSNLDMFVEHPEASARDAVHVVLVGKIERAGDSPNPDIEPVARANDFQTVRLETLVFMKLNANRDKDRVHLRDMISLGLIDQTWPDKYPEPLRSRLIELLNDPDG